MSLRLLTFSTLYPNERLPAHGVFVEQRLRKLIASGEAISRVIAPVPWFPFQNEYFGKYAALAKVPIQERRHDIVVEHPRYLRVPKVGMSLVPIIMAAAALRYLRAHSIEDDSFDLIDAHYFFPDGVAAVILAKQLGKPVTITARGTDLNLIPDYYIPRKMIQWAASEADGLITVCEALKETLTGLGVAGERVTVLRNGVDLEQFCPIDRVESRQALGIDADARMLLSVGHLIERKGHDIPLRALPELTGVGLVIVGEGEKRRELELLAEDLGVSERVRFAGMVSQDDLKLYYSAADALVLASSREGWANVLLESMACGTPVIASNVWGNPEVVSCREAGVIMEDKTPLGCTDAYLRLFRDYPDRNDTRRYAEMHSWDDTTNGQIDLMSHIISSR